MTSSDIVVIVSLSQSLMQMETHYNLDYNANWNNFNTTLTFVDPYNNPNCKQ